MDKGAHFHRCDFQVHTPRDRGWVGPGAVTDQERREYSTEFIAACRQKGLHAVAISDHHDMSFVPFIRRAAAEELGADGQPVPVDKRIVVFPAMELTLGVPCQALVLFDADFPDDLFSLATTALAIVPSASTEARTAETTRLNHIASLDKLAEEIDKHEYLRGRYIVLPNVSQGGGSTLLRQGHSAHYGTMPCVGGYLDGNIDQLGEGSLRILSGGDGNYGNKAIGLFQTSDNRHRDFSLLGRSSTWVKWALPTAEALRQACLARESRLVHASPSIPTTTITALDVSNSEFLGPIYLQFNPQYNALIGGRGTGKSTILEYIRWALCDEPSRVDDNLPGDQSRRRDLIDQTLRPLSAVVQLHVLVNGVPHVVRRAATTGDVWLKIGEGAMEPCKEVDIRNLLPIQAYSQKQLSAVGVRLEELRRFVNAPIRQALDDIRQEITVKGNELRAAYSRLRTKRQVQRDLDVDQRELRSTVEQTNAIRKELVGVDEADRNLLASQPAYEQEADLVDRWQQDFDKLRTVLVECERSLASLSIVRDDRSLAGLPNQELLERLKSDLLSEVVHARTALSQRLGPIQAPDEVGPFATAAKEWRFRYVQFEFGYDAAKTRSSAHQTKLAQLSDLETRAKAIRTKVSTRESELSSSGNPEQDVATIRAAWSVLHERRSNLINTQCQRLTELSDGQIRATIARGGSADAVGEKLKAMLAGTGVAKTKLDAVCALFSGAPDAIQQFQRILDELESLAVFTANGGEGAFPSTPLLLSAGVTEKEIGKIALKVSADAWLELAITPLDDQPKFEYRLREADYIPFSRASAGQQATALLWALLNQNGPPLVIDQPEDDLDNQVLLRVVGQIWRAKDRRQIVFSSHNANIVVNGDADLVVCCDYRIAGEQAGGKIKLEGAIDIPAVRDEIATVMEGGRAAFRLRKDKYGF